MPGKPRSMWVKVLTDIWILLERTSDLVQAKVWINERKLVIIAQNASANSRTELARLINGRLIVLPTAALRLRIHHTHALRNISAHEYTEEDLAKFFQELKYYCLTLLNIKDAI